MWQSAIRPVIDFIGHFTKQFQITDRDRIGNQAPFDFDVSVKDIYSAITTGATLVLVPKRLFALPPKLLDYLCDKKVTVMVWAVSALCLISSLKGLKYKIPEDARLIMFSGEVMPVKQMRLWQQARHRPNLSICTDHQRLPVTVPGIRYRGNSRMAK